MGSHEGRVALGAEAGNIGTPKEVWHAGPNLSKATEGSGRDAEDVLQGHPDAGLIPPDVIQDVIDGYDIRLI